MQAVDDVELEDLNHQLVVAAKDGDDARVAALIDRGADCNATHALGDVAKSFLLILCSSKSFVQENIKKLNVNIVIIFFIVFGFKIEV